MFWQGIFIPPFASYLFLYLRVAWIARVKGGCAGGHLVCGGPALVPVKGHFLVMAYF